MDVDDVADELYCLPVKHFTETRNSRAKELSASGDSKTAASVRKLRKPSQAAWLANQLVRRHPKEIEEIIGLGKDLRQAQDQSKGADLRRLSSNRQELSQRVLRLAADEAKTAGVPFGTDVQRQLVATIEAAMATESSGVALKTGRLSEALSRVGFGGVESTEHRNQSANGMARSHDPNRVVLVRVTSPKPRRRWPNPRQPWMWPLRPLPRPISFMIRRSPVDAILLPTCAKLSAR